MLGAMLEILMATTELKRPRPAAPDGELATCLDGRIDRLRADVMARKGSWVPDANPFERDVALWRARRPMSMG